MRGQIIPKVGIVVDVLIHKCRIKLGERRLFIENFIHGNRICRGDQLCGRHLQRGGHFANLNSRSGVRQAQYFSGRSIRERCHSSVLTDAHHHMIIVQCAGEAETEGISLAVKAEIRIRPESRRDRSPLLFRFSDLFFCQMITHVLFF